MYKSSQSMNLNYIPKNYEDILSLYRNVKHFPDNSNLITNPKNSTLTLKGKIDKYELPIHVLVYSVLFAVLSIMIIASVINYEVIFRPKFKKNNAFYSKSENATGLAFVIPVLSIMIVILVLGFLKYVKSWDKLFFNLF